MAAQGQQLRQAALVQEAVAAGQHQRVHIGLLQNIQTHLHVVDAQADMAQQAFGLHAAQLGQSLMDHLSQHGGVALAMAVNVAVMHIDHIQPGQAQPLQTVFHAAAYAGS